MKSKQRHSKFYRWWNSYTGRRIVGATYSLGASVVILGVLFKILYLPFAHTMLAVGMSVESFIFALGVFDKPYREFDWSKIFDFKSDEKAVAPSEMASMGVSGVLNVNSLGGGNGGNFENNGNSQNGNTDGIVVQNSGASNSVQASGGGFAFTESLSEDDVQKLSEGISNLTKTAESLQKLSELATSTDKFAQSIESASQIASKYNETQAKLNAQAESLADAYVGVNSEMNNVTLHTRNYASNVNSINGNIDSIKANYDEQLNYIKTHTEKLQQQLDKINSVTNNIDDISTETNKLKALTSSTLEENQRYQNATRRLTEQVENLNAVYGNMLNALS